MKQGHFLAMYMILYLICFISLLIEQYQYDQVLEEKQRIEQGLQNAVELAAWELTSVLKEAEQVKKQTVEECFFESLYVSLGLTDEKEEQERLRMYIPMIVLAEEDGAFFYYLQEVQENGVTELRHMWSEKLTYICQGDVTEKKKVMIAEQIEKKASEIISNHNYIAKQYGFTYSFFVPKFLQDVSKPLEFPMIFVVFQGWPLDATGDVIYENCIDAGAYIQKVKKYAVEIPTSIFQTYAYYHVISCEHVGEHEGRILEKIMTEEQAVRDYGAYPCEFCIE